MSIEVKVAIITAIITAIGVIVTILTALLPKMHKPDSKAPTLNKDSIVGVYNVYYQYASVEKLSIEFIFSRLRINKNGSAEFENNIVSEMSSPEYVYSGTWDMEQDTIYLYLKNRDSKERLFVVLMTSVGELNRMLGILSGMSAAANPVAVKIACFRSKSTPENINKSVLAEVFEQPNRIWKNNVLIFEESEKIKFFSNAIKETPHNTIMS